MRAVVFSISLMLLSGCGSCVEEKPVPNVDPAPATAATVRRSTDGGLVLPIVVGDDGVRVSRFASGDGGAEAGK